MSGIVTGIDDTKAVGTFLAHEGSRVSGRNQPVRKEL